MARTNEVFNKGVLIPFLTLCTTASFHRIDAAMQQLAKELDPVTYSSQSTSRETNSIRQLGGVGVGGQSQPQADRPRKTDSGREPIHS